MPKKIVTFFNGLLSKSLGPAIHFTELWNSFSTLYKNEYEVKAYVGGEKNSSFQPLKFKCTYTALPNIRRVRFLILDIVQAFHIIRNRKSIIYYRLTVNSFAAYIALKYFAKHYIVELNGIVEQDLSTMGLPNWFNKLSIIQANGIIKNSTACIGVSNKITQHALSKGAPKAFTIKNGVADYLFDTDRNKKSTKLSAVYIGTFTPFDGADKVVELAESFPEIDFYLYGIGDNHLRSKLMEKAPANVHFPGYVNYTELGIIYQQHDLGIVLYIPERNNSTELSSLKTLEYIACGLPIFTTNVKGQEFVSESKIGVNIELQNLIPEFKSFISQLPMYNENIEKFRKLNREKISWQRCAISTMEVIEACFK
jgi:glycosyltransferase involved in cell wall biosynthesis